MGALELLCCR